MTSYDKAEWLAGAPMRQPHPLALPLIVSLVLAALATWMAIFIIPTNLDVAWLVLVGERTLEGARLHYDIIEGNPPFSVWLYLPLVYAEKWVGIRAEYILAVTLPILAFASVGVAARILNRAGWFSANWTGWLLPLAVWFLAYSSPYDFGQREQIATIALLPWLALLIARERTSDFQAGTGYEVVLAGLGAAVFAITKPPLGVFAIIAPAVFVAARRRSVRCLFTPETIIAAMISIFYVGWVLTVERAYLTEVLPMLSEQYQVMRLSILDIVSSRSFQMLLIFSASTLIFGALAGRDPASSILLIAAFGYVPCYLLLGKGWHYQALPFVLVSLLAFIIQIANPLSRNVGRLPKLMLFALVASTAAQPLYRALTLAKGPSPEMIAAISSRAGAHPTVMSVATYMPPAHPLARAINGRYLSRYPSLWRVRSAEMSAQYEVDPQRLASLHGIIRDQIAEAAGSIVKERPDVVIGGGKLAYPGEKTVMSDPAMVMALKPYHLIWQDQGTSVFLRTEKTTSR